MNKIISLVADNIGVDAGIIIVCDLQYLQDKSDLPDVKFLTKMTNLGQILNVPNGKYDLKWSIEDTYNGPVNGQAKIEITTGKLAVIDPCYVIGARNHESWLGWLDQEFDHRPIANVTILDSMGGDGCYKVEIELTPIVEA